VRVTASCLAILCVGCGGGSDALALDLEIKEAKADELQLVVKTLPGAEIKFEGQTKTAGEKSGDTFAIPKSRLKLGTNTFTVDATGGFFLSKKSATKSATFDAQPKNLLRFEAPAAVSEPEGTLACEGSMCGAATFKTTRAGKLPVEVKSVLAASLTIDGKKLEVGPGKSAPVEIDLAPRFAGAAAGHSDKLALPVVLESGGAKASDTLTLAGTALSDLAALKLASIEQGPVILAGEAASADPADLLVVVGFPGRKLIAVGKAGKLQDVDFVGVGKPAERFFSCAKSGQPDGTGILYTDLDVKVYDRRTGASVGSKKLLADRVPCPPEKSGQTKVKSDVREDDVRRVLAEFLKK
jgi:hypothetical protein